jgi:hypothetical protein
MDSNEAEGIAVGIMDDHELLDEGWTFGFDNAVKRLGFCSYERKRITVSKHFTSEATERQFTQVVLHEVAHALLPSERADGTAIGHGPEWLGLARRIGYLGGRTAYNPYAAKNAPKRKPVRRPAGLKTYIKPGDILWMPLGDTGISGELITRGRTRFHIRLDDGRTYNAPFSICVKIAEKGTAFV